MRFLPQEYAGFKNAWMMLSAPQLKVRHTRRPKGLRRIERSQWDAGAILPDEVGVSPSVSPKFPVVSFRYVLTDCSQPGATYPAIRIRMASCAKSRSAG